MEGVDWSNGSPRSARFGDVYHSRSGALAQADHVFLGGCDLPGAWQGKTSWRIVETGFGLGLNFLATWLAWRGDPKRPDRLVFESIEAWPVAPADLLRAAASHPPLVPLAAELAAGLATAPAWQQGGDPGQVSLSFEAGRVRLKITIGDAGAAPAEPASAPAWPTQPADSVYLDGFSPALNPAIWSAPVLAAIAARTRPGGRLATWTVAAAVRRALVAGGFAVEKRPGLPPKRHCLAAWKT